MFTQSPSPSSADRVLLSAEEFNLLWKEIEPEMRKTYETEVAPLVNQRRQLIQDKENLVAYRDRLDQEIADSKERQAKALQGLKKVDQDRQNILTRQFYGIFNGNKKLPVEETNALYMKYLAEKDLSVEETAEGKSFGKIKNMRPVIKYLKDHPDIKSCDFRSFEDQIEDIGVLTTFLTEPSCKINNLAFKNCIPLEAKNKLAEAIAAKKGKVEDKKTYLLYQFPIPKTIKG